MIIFWEKLYSYLGIVYVYRKVDNETYDLPTEEVKNFFIFFDYAEKLTED